MRKIMWPILACLVGLTLGGCTKSGSEGAEARHAGHQAAPGQVSDATVKGMVDVVQEQKLTGYSGSTVGEAFGAYSFFDKKEWKETRSDNGRFYIDFVGWAKPGMLEAVSSKNGSTVKGVEVKFVINSDGGFYVAMVSKIASGADGKLSAYPLADNKRVMDAIYANKQITF
jgi:hypothetical protein